MNDKELADAIVALGVGKHEKGVVKEAAFFEIDGDLHNENYSEEMFVRDWRVAGAILSEAEGTMDAEDFYHTLLPLFHEAEMSNPRAIIEACVKALEVNDE